VVCYILVHIGIQQHSIDDMEYAVLGQHIRLGDASGGVARRDEFSTRVGAELEVLTGRGDVGDINKGWAVDSCPVDDVVPQNVPEYSIVVRELRELCRSFVGGDQEGKTTDAVKNLSDADVLQGVVPRIPDWNLGVVGKIGEACQRGV